MYQPIKKNNAARYTWLGTQSLVILFLSIASYVTFFGAIKTTYQQNKLTLAKQTNLTHKMVDQKQKLQLLQKSLHKIKKVNPRLFSMRYKKANTQSWHQLIQAIKQYHLKLHAFKAPKNHAGTLSITGSFLNFLRYLQHWRQQYTPLTLKKLSIYRSQNTGETHYQLSISNQHEK